MIYEKNANFPYPILSPYSTSFNSLDFRMEVELTVQPDVYLFDLEAVIDSTFIRKLIMDNLAKIYFVIQSRDNQFFELTDFKQRVTVKKTDISFDKRTKLQMHIRSMDKISYAENYELNDFFQSFRQELFVPKHSLIGFSQVVQFQGFEKEDFDLFERRFDPTLDSELAIELTSSKIIISYKDEKFMFPSLIKKDRLINPYIYLGLQKALFQFIDLHQSENEEPIEIAELPVPDDELSFKLYQLMKNKKVELLDFNTVDSVIYQISDQLISKFTSAVEEVARRGN